MNRASGDYFETLLYKVFVSLDERTTIQQLATLLQLSLDAVKYAVSVYCRLGFAKKKNPPPLRPTAAEAAAATVAWHPSWLAPQTKYSSPAYATSLAAPSGSSAPTSPTPSVSGSASFRGDDLLGDDLLREPTEPGEAPHEEEARPSVSTVDLKGTLVKRCVFVCVCVCCV